MIREWCDNSHDTVWQSGDWERSSRSQGFSLVPAGLSYLIKIPQQAKINIFSWELRYLNTNFNSLLCISIGTCCNSKITREVERCTAVCLYLQRPLATCRDVLVHQESSAFSFPILCRIMQRSSLASVSSMKGRSRNWICHTHMQCTRRNNVLVHWRLRSSHGLPPGLFLVQLVIKF